VEDRAVVEAILRVLQEVLDGLGRLVGGEFDDDDALIGFEFDLRVGGMNLSGKQEGG